jgi:dihydrodipicolinate synthase/N-acetylneuraminate lyase
VTSSSDGFGLSCALATPLSSVTAVTLSVSLIGKLRAAFPEVICGVKDSSGDWPYTQQLLAAHSDLAIFTEKAA